MKNLLFVHWNILYKDGMYFCPDIQELHKKLMKTYSHVFSDVIVVLHTDNYHDIGTIHNIKLEFSKIFRSVTFKVKKNFENVSSYNDTFVEDFLPLIEKHKDEYDLIYYAHDKGIHHPQERLQKDLKFWVASLYYYNFNYIAEHLDNLTENQFIIGGCLNEETLVSSQLNINTEFSIDHHFPGSFYGIVPNRYYSFVKQNNISLYTLVGTPEFHFFVNASYDNILHDTHINVLKTKVFENPKDNFYLNGENIIKENTSDIDYSNICKLLEQ